MPAAAPGTGAVTLAGSPGPQSTVVVGPVPTAEPLTAHCAPAAAEGSASRPIVALLEVCEISVSWGWLTGRPFCVTDVVCSWTAGLSRAGDVPGGGGAEAGLRFAVMVSSVLVAPG